MSDWRSEAACKGKPTKWFFPESDGEASAGVLALCAECPVREECLAYGMTLPRLSEGIYGGLTERQRERLRRTKRSSRVARRLNHLGSLVIEGRPHGTRASYLVGCRCDPCTDAATAYSRQQRAKAATR